MEEYKFKKSCWLARKISDKDFGNFDAGFSFEMRGDNLDEIDDAITGFKIQAMKKLADIEQEIKAKIGVINMNTEKIKEVEKKIKNIDEDIRQLDIERAGLENINTKWSIVLKGLKAGDEIMKFEKKDKKEPISHSTPQVEARDYFSSG